HCWRCKSPLMYTARSGWFIKTTAIKEELIKANQGINWLPNTIKDGRMGNWLENVIDWCLSRDRYWGTPLPVWKCECGHYHVVGSKEELKKLAKIDGDIELHKPFVDKIEIKCEKCGKMMKRELDVIDCWYDSGSMPFAQFHYPFENKEEFAKRFPADFISEGVDQCRGWFYALLVINVALFGKSPYKSVISNGLVVDEQGQKLSKSLGNFTPPMQLLEEVGADAVRWTFYTEGQPWSNLGMTPAIAKATVKNYFGTLWNVYSFFVLYANIDKFNPSSYKLEDCKLSVMDKWILSEFNTLVENVTTELNQLHCTEPARAMQDFINDLSNWYIRRCRKRYWVGGMSEDKKSAYMTLWFILTEFSKLSAPFTPFISETIYQNLVVQFFKDSPISVHLTNYPVANKKYIDKKLKQDMKITYAYTELGRKARSTYNLKIRQPLSKLYLTDATEKTDLSEEMTNILKEELNVKEVIQNADLNKFMSYKLKPQLRTIGPKYGKFLNDIREYLNACETNKVVETVKKGEIYKFEVKGNKFELSNEDLLIEVEQKANYASSIFENFAVILDTTLTTQLIDEGYVREFVSKIQNLRKSSGFEVTDRIEITLNGDADIVEIITNNSKDIAEDVLAVKFEKSIQKQATILDLNDKTISVSIKKSR
ncbi:MAG: class I tRNA ligase family protein, partial [Clostridia bacterium]|nr:class I tRNA ligase family protein [Clostridia bacterium]